MKGCPADLEVGDTAGLETCATVVYPTVSSVTDSKIDPVSLPCQRRTTNNKTFLPFLYPESLSMTSTSRLHCASI